MPVPNAFGDLSTANVVQIRGEGPARFVANTTTRLARFQDTPEWHIKDCRCQSGRVFATNPSWAFTPHFATTLAVLRSPNAFGTGIFVLES